MTYLIWTLSLTLLFQSTAFWSLTSKPITTKSTQAAAKGRERAKQWRRHIEIARASFSRGRRLMLARGVPFDPDFLLRPQWRKALAKKLAAMPEMKATKREGSRLKGVYMADTLYLPSEIETEGDTVILARKIIYEGCGATIKGKGLIALFPIEPVESRISINEFRRLQKRQAFMHSFAPSTTTINLSTFRRVGAYMQGQCGDTNINRDGADRTEQAAEGIFHPPDGPPLGTGPQGSSGTCAGNPNDGMGGTGDLGTIGVDSGNGSPGIPGGDATSAIMCTIPCGSTSTYTFSARGGRGQKGGVGAPGTPGSPGQKGGTGGPGANCCSTGGIRGNGGTGGTGGRGGPGGSGGKGGNGGNGGSGRNITITFPTTFQGSVSLANINGGEPGAAGQGGPAAPRSPGGEGGSPGAPAPDLPLCGNPPSAGAPGQTGPEGSPGNGTLGPGGNGSTGTAGVYSPTEYSCGDEDLDGDGYCVVDGDCDDTDPGKNPGEDPNCYSGMDADFNCNGTLDVEEFYCTSPIIINFTGGLKLTSPDDGVWFDISAVGIKRLVSWTRAGADDAFLALDRNGNGTIDDGGELFGTRTRLLSGSNPVHNGFEALAEFDLPAAGGNINSVIDPGDEKFPQLLVWQDTNHNGLSEPTELRPLTATNIGRIDVEYFHSSRQDQYGNEFLYRAKVYFRNESDAKNIDSHKKWAYDVGLVVAR